MFQELMNRLRLIMAAFNPNRTTTLRNPAAWFLDALGYSSTESGVRVDGRSLLSYAPMWYAVNRISGHIGIMPVKLCQYLPDGDIRTADPREFPEINVVNRTPNEFMTGCDMRETTQSHAIVHGNGRCAILRNGLGQAVELIPMAPEATQTYLLYQEGEVVQKWHYYTTPDGREIPLPDRDVLHIKGLAGDGLVGYSLVNIAKESIGGALAAEKYVNRSYRNNGMPSIILEAPEGAFRNDQHAKDFLEAFHGNHGGLDNVNKPGLLRFGVTARQISQTNTDAQFLENRRFSREEAALWTAIESMLGIEQGESYNSLAQKNEAYRQNCLARWMRKWEQELDNKLLSRRQRAAGYFWKFETYALLSGSIKERYEALAIGRTIQLLSQEEARRMEHLGKPNAGENYDNPNTTAGGSETTSETDNENEDTETRARIRSAIVANLAYERHALLDIAGRAEGFLDRVQSYYDRFGHAIEARLAGVGGTRDVALRWIRESQAAILDLTQQVQPAELQRGVADMLDTWGEDRVEQFVDLIFQGQEDERAISV